MANTVGDVVLLDSILSGKTHCPQNQQMESASDYRISFGQIWIAT